MIRQTFIFCAAFLCSTAIHSQCNSPTIAWIDSTGKEVHHQPSTLAYSINKESFVIQLDDMNLTMFSAFPGMKMVVPEKLEDEINQTVGIDQSQEKQLNCNLNSYCTTCINETIKRVDSIDVTNDGIKELLILREGSCSYLPAISTGCCGVGGKQQYASQYEIWDLESQKCLFKVQVQYHFSMAVTVNTMVSESYRIDFKLDKKGVVHLSNKRGETARIAEGTYRYDSEYKEYRIFAP